MELEIKICIKNFINLRDKIKLIILPIKERLNKRVVEFHQEQYIENNSPLRSGDKDVWIKEEFREIKAHSYRKSCEIFTILKSERRSSVPKKWESASKMTKEQSKFCIDEVLSVRVVKIQEISIAEIEKITGMNPKVYRQENLNRAYLLDFRDWINERMDDKNFHKNNPYVLLLETTPIKEKDK